MISGSVAFVKKRKCETNMLKKAKYNLSDVTCILGRCLAMASDAEFYRLLLEVIYQREACPEVQIQVKSQVFVLFLAIVLSL